MCLEAYHIHIAEIFDPKITYIIILKSKNMHYMILNTIAKQQEEIYV